MASIQEDIGEKVFKISQFLGVNENPDGDTHLKLGEAAHLSNFRITENYALQKRQGSQNVAGLLSAYTISVAASPTNVATDLNTPTSTFTAYPTIRVSDGGVLALSGTAVTVNYGNLSSYVGYYWQKSSTGLIYQLGSCSYEPPSSGSLVAGGSVTVSATDTFIRYVGFNTSYTSYAEVALLSGTLSTTGTATTSLADQQAINKFVSVGGLVYKVSRFVDTGRWGESSAGSWLIYDEYGYLVSRAGDDSYNWSFYLVTAATGSTDISVRGIWSGYVDGLQYLAAACNGKLWRLTENGGVWTKEEIGTLVTTRGPVHLFGFDKKLYILDGDNYRVWDGTTLALVLGYRPLVSISTLPSGGGSVLEQVNKLNGLRRAWFSPNGTASVFQLPEKGLASVDYVKSTADDTGVAFSADLASGAVSLSSPPATGTNSLEIGWTVSTTYRAQVLAMRYSETYNGETDTRLFLYGDGSNQAFYSGLDYEGNPRADYFPDLNVMAVDSANTPITALIKHYDRLLVFKSDGSFITTYGSQTLADGTTATGFYTTPLNRQIGNAAMGQAVLVQNNPFTLYGRSVYEWALSRYAGRDERNAETKSDRVAKTLSTFDFESALCFDDEIHCAYYVIQNGTACVYNYKADAWYIYTDMPATCLIAYKQEIYYGDTAGNIRHFSRDYTNDNGKAIACYYESGSMDFGADFKRKFSPGLWLGIKPEHNGEIYVSVDTDRARDCSDTSVVSQYTDSVVSGFFSFLNLDFTRLSFGINTNPQMNKLAIKVKQFVYYKLLFSSVSADTTVTVTSADIRVRYTGKVR